MQAGTELFLIHGWCANADCWQRVSAGLSRRHRLTIVELPGHGGNISSGCSLAQPEALIDYWLTTAPEQAVWVGWSLGGLLAQLAAIRAPGKVRKVVSLCMGARFMRDAQWLSGADPAAMEKIRTMLHGNPPQCLETFIHLQTTGAEHEHDTASLLRKMMDAPFEMEELNAGLNLLETLDLRKTAGQMQPPVLFIAGGHDQVSNKNALQASAELASHGHYMEISNAGHAPMLSHPAQVIDLIDDFLS